MTNPSADFQLVHRGGVHTVLRGTDAEGRAVVIKRLTERVPHPSHVASLVAEYRLLTELVDVPGLVRAVALEWEGILPVLVMQDMGATALSEVDGGMPWSEDRVLPMLASLAYTLALLHDRGVMHRDLNPHNVVLAEDGSPVVVDLGLATRFIGLDPVRQTQDSAVGTLSYMAPELTGRTGLQADHRADLYGLGATLYQLLTGAPPFVRPTRGEVLHAHMALPPDPLVGVSDGLGNLVLGLLAKDPGDRPGDAWAVFERTVAIAAQQDVPVTVGGEVPRTHARLLPPSKLVERQEILLAAQRALRRASACRGSLLVVQGVLGAGRSFVMRASGLSTAGQGRIVGTATLSEAAGQRPRAGLIEALGAAVSQLALRPTARSAASERLLASLDGVADVAVGLVPSLAEIIGTRAPAAPVGPMRQRNRVHSALLGVMQGLGRRGCPLVLVLEDAHLADEATISLLKDAAAELVHWPLVLVLTVRAESLQGDQPFNLALAELQATTSVVQELTISLLSQDGTAALCSDVLGAPVNDNDSLIDLVHRHSAGNPQRALRLLEQLVDQSALTAAPRSWHWDAELASGLDLDATTGREVATLLAGLPAPTGRAVALAGLFGPLTPLSALAELMGHDLRATAALLEPALSVGVVSARGLAWRTGWGGDLHESVLRELDPGIAFVDKGMRAAASDLLPQAERAQAHLDCARIIGLLGPANERLPVAYQQFAHLQAGQSHLVGPQARRAAAQVAQLASRASSQHAAPDHAWTAAECGLSWLAPDASDPLAQDLRLQAARSGWLSGHAQRALELLDQAHAASVDAPSRLRIVRERVRLFTLSGRLQEALDLGKQALSTHGLAFSVPTDVDGPGVDHQATARSGLLALGPAGLAQLSPVHDPAVIAELTLLQELVPPAFFLDQSFFAQLVDRIVERTVAFGISDASSYAITFTGHLLASQGQVADGLALAQAGVALARARRDEVGGGAAALFACQALFTYAHHVQHWRGALALDGPLYDEAFASGKQAGDLHWAGFALAGRVMWRLSWCPSLSDLATDVNEARTFLEGIGDATMVELVEQYAQVLVQLGGAAGPVARPEPPSSPMVRAVGAVVQALCHVAVDDYDLARAAVEVAEAGRTFLQGCFVDAELDMLAGLVKAEAGDTVALATHLHALERRQVHAPENLSHKVRLLQAELAWLEGRHWDALERWDQAADGAASMGFLQDAALSMQRAARRLAAAGRTRLAPAYADSARRAWRLWGAEVPLAVLSSRYPELGPVAGSSSSSSSSSGSSRSGSRIGRAQQMSVDLEAVVKAAEALAVELDVEPLKERILQAAVQIAGARRGSLLLAADDGMRVVGTLSPEGYEPRDEPLVSTTLIPAALIYRSRELRQPVVVDDARQDLQLRSDPWVVANQARSLMVVPARRQRRLVAVLVLENELMPAAFTERRVRALGLLGSQIAIAVENARLFDRVRKETQERLAAERNLVRAQKLETLGRLAGGVAHDFNNLLAVILGWAELAQVATNQDGMLDDALVQISSTAERGANLTRQLLAFSRRSVMRPAALSLPDLLDGLQRMVDRLLGDKVQLVVQPAPSDLPPVWADPSLIEQVFTNLFINARDAMSDGGTISVTFDRFSDPPDLAPGDYVAVRVSDQGPGIPEAMRERIFEPFFSTKGAGGTGLGLATSRGIAEQSGGDLLVSASAQSGTTFTVLLPVTDRALPTPTPRDDAPIDLSGTVLLVEDDPALRTMLELALQSHGLVVSAAPDGRAALTLLDDGLIPDMLITDLSMPGMSGLEVIHAVRERLPDLPAVLFSGLAEADMGSQLPPGVVFRQKPIRPAQLVRALESLVRTPRG